MLRYTYLTENVVVNVDDVTKFAERMAASVKAPECKAWFAKKLRGFILNDASIMDRVPPQEIHKGMPAYVLQAAEKNEPVYSFSPVSPNLLAKNFDDRIQHIKDFFDSLYDVASAEPNADNPVEVEHQVVAKKILSKLQKMNLPQVEQAHELWGERAGRQVKNMSKEGCEVAITFGNGFYWVRYTDLNTMKRDGQDLQNCLRTGNYWEAVQKGTQAVYGLRTPSSEAVVGVRVLLTGTPEIVECKGKNNLPALPEYVPYILALLKKLGVKNASADLKNAGIHVNNGTYGTFEDIADVVYDKDGTKVMRVDESDSMRYLVRVRRHQFWARSKDGVLTELTGLERLPLPVIVAGLDAVGLPASGTPLAALAELGIFPSDKGYGTIDEVGKTVWTGMSDGDRAVSTMRDGSGYLFVFRNDVATRLTVEKKVIFQLPRLADSAFLRYAIPAFNAAKVRLSVAKDREEMWPIGLISTRKGYEPIDEVSKVVYKFNDTQLREVVAPTFLKGKIYSLAIPNSNYVTFLGNDNVAISGMNNVSAQGRAVAASIQFLAGHDLTFSDYHYEDHSQELNLGIFHDPQTYDYVSKLDDLLKMIRVPENNAKYDYLCEFGGRGHFHRTLRTAFQALRDSNGELAPKVQAKIFNALKPSKDQLVKIVNETSWDVHGKKMHSLEIAPADQLHVIGDCLPDYRDQINTIMDAVTKAMEILARKYEKTAFLKLLVEHDYGYGRKFLPWGRIVEDANHKTQNYIKQLGDEAYARQDADPDKTAHDQFASMNHARRARIR